MSTKVLVFEHDANFASELRRELARIGCNVTVVDDGNAGLAQAASDRPDLILLSIELPRMNGFSVCNKLKKDAALKDVPLLIMSSESSEETFEQHKKLRTRAEDYVHKPIAFGELYQHMQALLPSLGGSGPSSGEADIVIEDEIVVGDLDDENDMTQVGQLPPAVREQLAARARKDAPKPHDTDAEMDAFADAAFDNLLGSAASPKPKAAEAPKQAAAAPAAAADNAEISRLRTLHATLEAELTAARRELESRAAQLSAATAKASHLEESLASASASAAPNPVHEEARRIAEATVEDLRGQLDRATADAQHKLEAEVEAARSKAAADAEQRISLLEEEAQRLQRELAAAKRPASVAPPAGARPAGVSTRDFLELRETLNKKDKEILGLKDQINSSEKGSLDLKDKLFALERTNVELDEKCTELARQLAETQRLKEAFEADKEMAVKRGDDLQKRFDAAKAHGESVEKQLSDERTALADEKAGRVADAAAAAAAQQAALEAAAASLASALAEQERTMREAADRRAQDDKTAHEAATAKASEDAASARAGLEADHKAALEAAAKDKDDALASARAERESAVAAAQAEKAEAIAAAEADKARAIEAAEASKATAIADAEREKAQAIEAAQADKRQALEAAEADKARAIEAAEAEKKQAIEAAEADKRQAIEAAEADKRQAIEAAEADKARAIEAAEADKRQAIEAAETDKNQAVGAAHTQRTREVGERDARIATLEGELSRAAAVESDLHAKVEGLDRDVSDLRRRLDDATARLGKADEKWAADRASLDRAKDALAEVLTRLEEPEGRSF